MKFTELMRRQMKSMIDKQKQVPYLIYPENLYKEHWDNFVTLLLIFSCVVTPYRIALVSEDTLDWTITNAVIDIMFLIDIFLCFNTAYYDEDFVTIDSRCTIAKTYLTGWFFIDVMAIFPFDLVTTSGDSGSSTNANEMIRLTRLGRMYKIVKLVRLVRILKLQKKKKTRSDAPDQARVEIAFKRIMFFIMNFILVTHIFTCVWIIVGQLDQESTDSWMYGDVMKMDNHN